MKLTNPLLVKVATEATNGIAPQLREALVRAVGAGDEIMYAKQTRKLLMNQMSQGQDVAVMAGEGVAKLVGIIWYKAEGKMPLRVLIPAGIVLVCHALEFLMDAGVIDNVTPQQVDTATQEYASSFLQLLGVTPEKLQAILQKGADNYQQQAQGQPAPAPQPQPAGGIISGAAQGA